MSWCGVVLLVITSAFIFHSIPEEEPPDIPTRYHCMSQPLMWFVSLFCFLFACNYVICDPLQHNVCVLLQHNVCEPLQHNDICEPLQHNVCDLLQHNVCDLLQHNVCESLQHNDVCEPLQHIVCDPLQLFNHSTDYLDIIEKLVSVLSISSENFYLICIFSGGNFHMKNMIRLPFLLSHSCVRLDLQFARISFVKGLSLATFEVLGSKLGLICIKSPKICKSGKVCT
jgi:hypothetical protein